jgi:hypothetical protein
VHRRRAKDEDWLDCESPAWLQGYDDGFTGRQTDVHRDGRAHSRLSSEYRNYADGFVTGQTEREVDEDRTEG